MGDLILGYFSTCMASASFNCYLRVAKRISSSETGYNMQCATFFLNTSIICKTIAGYQTMPCQRRLGHVMGLAQFARRILEITTLNKWQGFWDPIPTQLLMFQPPLMSCYLFEMHYYLLNAIQCWVRTRYLHCTMQPTFKLDGKWQGMRVCMPPSLHAASLKWMVNLLSTRATVPRRQLMSRTVTSRIKVG